MEFQGKTKYQVIAEDEIKTKKVPSFPKYTCDHDFNTVKTCS